VAKLIERRHGMKGVEAVRRDGTLRRRRTSVEGGGRWQVLEIVEDERGMGQGEIDHEDDRRWRSPRDRIRGGGGRRWMVSGGRRCLRGGPAA
jgi:hypothetical protein